MEPIKPMLAVPEKKADIRDWNDWCFEEKFDGHRLIVHVSDDDGVKAYARPRGDGRMLLRPLPSHLVETLERFPEGWFDGELMVEDGRDPWQHTDVVRLDLQHRLTFVVFDILAVGEWKTFNESYDDRRKMLHEIFLRIGMGTGVRLAESTVCGSEANVRKMIKAVWKAGGEGAILKRRKGIYQPGKRSPDFAKLKRVELAALTLVGFEKSRGTVMGRGDYAICVLRDDDGNETTCKTLDDHELARIEKAHVDKSKPHPWSCRRKLVIEFNKRTRTGGYEGPVRWDRWEDE